MFRSLKKRLQELAEEVQRSEIARLHQETMQLKEQIERETGCPIQFTPDEQLLLAEKSKGIDPETVKKLSVFARDNFTTAEIENDSTEIQ